VLVHNHENAIDKKPVSYVCRVSDRGDSRLTDQRDGLLRSAIHACGDGHVVFGSDRIRALLFVPDALHRLPHNGRSVDVLESGMSWLCDLLLVAGHDGNVAGMKTQAMKAADDLLDSIIESKRGEELFCWRPSDIEGDVSAFEVLTDAERRCFEQNMRMLEALEPDVPFTDRTRH
jgi:hypothetical protein